MIHNSPQPILEDRHMKVDQQPYRYPRKLKIGQKLGIMERQEIFDGLKFHDYQFLNNQIHPVSTVQFDSLIRNRQWDLTAEVQGVLGQLVTRALFVRRL